MSTKKPMLVAIHQPHYIPWLGYVDRMRRADVFVILDHVQFERRNFQNRTTILLEGEPKLLTVPVVQVSQKETILEKAVDNSETGSRQWGPNHFKTLKYAYRKAPFFAQYAPRLQEILEARWEKLVDLDLAMLDFVRDAFQITTPLMRSSQMKTEGARSELLLNICREIGPHTAFLGGLGGSRKYLDHEAFAEAGIGVAWQRFTHPAYPQCSGTAFVPGLMSLDALFNYGPTAFELLDKNGIVHDERIAA